MTKHPLTQADLHPLLLIQQARNVYKVSTLYTHGFTAELVYPVPRRTTVRMFPYDALVSLNFTTASDTMVARYEAAWAR